MDIIDFIVIGALCNISVSAVLLDNQTEVYFCTTVDVHQGCPVSFTSAAQYLLCTTLHNHHTLIFIGEMPICNLCFADDIDLLAGTNKETLTSYQQTDKQTLDRNRHSNSISAIVKFNLFKAIPTTRAV